MSNLIKGLAAAGLMTCSGMASALTFSDKFEGYTFSDTSVLEPVYTFFADIQPAGGCAGGYTYFGGAPNFTNPVDGPRISALTSGEGGVNQGVQGLSVFPDFNNPDINTNGCTGDISVFDEQIIAAGDEGKTFVFRFDYKNQTGGLPGSGAVFMKILDPGNGFAEVDSTTLDITAAPDTWTEIIELSLTTVAGYAGYIFQVGFNNVTTGNVAATSFFDNLCVFEAGSDAICSSDRSSGAPAGGLVSFSDNFEGYGAAPYVGDELANAGYVYSNNVFAVGGAFKFNYNGGAPSAGPQISAIATGEGGAPQGTYQLNVYSDYDCCTGGTEGHGAGEDVQVNVVQEQTPGAADVGTTWQFAFDAKGGNILTAPNGTASAFVKVLDPDAGFSEIASDTVDLTATPNVWTGYSLTLNITAGMVGKLLQFGFENTSTSFANTGVFYDNLDFNPLPAGCVGSGTDTDGDGVDDNCDNCSAVANPGQEDTDADGFGNICDGDFDNSCLVTGIDLGIFKAAFFTADPLTDMDSSGLVTGIDLGLFKNAFFQPPGPSGTTPVCTP